MGAVTIGAVTVVVVVVVVTVMNVTLIVIGPQVITVGSVVGVGNGSAPHWAPAGSPLGGSVGVAPRGLAGDAGRAAPAPGGGSAEGCVAGGGSVSFAARAALTGATPATMPMRAAAAARRLSGDMLRCTSCLGRRSWGRSRASSRLARAEARDGCGTQP
jgi:hypothetical protein